MTYFGLTGWNIAIALIGGLGHMVWPDWFHICIKGRSRAHSSRTTCTMDDPSPSDESLDYFEDYKMTSDYKLDYVSANDTTLKNNEPFIQYSIRRWNKTAPDAKGKCPVAANIQGALWHTGAAG